MALPTLAEFIQKLEGPYKWYVIMAVILVLTAFFSRFVFKTIKWFLMIIALGVIMLAVVMYLTT
ncbi:MAG: hypothetical protein WEA04_02925 [Candidatus Andersenbacteria bacterium]